MVKKWRILSAIFCKEKADGIKPSALTVLTIKLESEYNFGPDYLFVSIAFTGFKISIFNACYNVFSKGYISTYIKALIAVTEFFFSIFGVEVGISRICCITAAEQSRLQIGSKWTVAVVSI